MARISCAGTDQRSTAALLTRLVRMPYVLEARMGRLRHRAGATCHLALLQLLSSGAWPALPTLPHAQHRVLVPLVLSKCNRTCCCCLQALIPGLAALKQLQPRYCCLGVPASASAAAAAFFSFACSSYICPMSSTVRLP